MDALPPPVQRLLDASPYLASAGQLRALGYSYNRITGWSAAGLLRKVLAGVYRAGEAAPSPTESFDAPLLALNAGQPPARLACLSGSANLALRAVEGFDLPVARPSLVVPRGRRVRWTDPPFEVLERALLPGDAEMLRRRPALSAGCALADAAAEPAVTERRLRVGVDHLRAHERFDVERWAGRLRAFCRHRGAARLLDMYACGVFDHESEGERTAFRRLFVAHPPAPDHQVVLIDRLRVDFVFLFAALAVEYLGDVHRVTLDYDSSRTLRLTGAGYLVVPVTGAMVRDDPVGVAMHIHALRRQREALAARDMLHRAPLPVQPRRRVALRTHLPLG